MDQGFKNLVEKANSGNIDAMVMVADCYNRGLQTNQDDSKAQTYYKMAADKGHPAAAFMVSIGYLNGIGTRKSKSDAIKYMQFAADKGLANAQYLLGSLYKSGEIGLFFKEQKAVHYLEKASKQGHAKAQIALGDMNITNNGAQYTLEKGLFWLTCAYLHGENAKEESQDAMNRLNTLLQSGLPGGKNRIDQIIESIKKNYPSYITNPQ